MAHQWAANHLARHQRKDGQQAENILPNIVVPPVPRLLCGEEEVNEGGGERVACLPQTVAIDARHGAEEPPQAVGRFALTHLSWVERLNARDNLADQVGHRVERRPHVQHRPRLEGHHVGHLRVGERKVLLGPPAEHQQRRADYRRAARHHPHGAVKARQRVRHATRGQLPVHLVAPGRRARLEDANRLGKQRGRQHRQRQPTADGLPVGHVGGKKHPEAPSHLLVEARAVVEGRGEEGEQRPAALPRIRRRMVRRRVRRRLGKDLIKVGEQDVQGALADRIVPLGGREGVRDAGAVGTRRDRLKPSSPRPAGRPWGGGT